jgi:formate hydrogenlyase subunit 6/NADH:ubiquinone oxidoreductase subunit I
MSTLVLSRADFGILLSTLTDRGYSVVGPTIGEGSIVYGSIVSVDDLPIGWTDDQEAGTYRLRRRQDHALFGYAVGSQSWKKYLFKPRETLIEVKREDGSLAFTVPEVRSERLALLGVRACELAAIAIQDKVFLESGPVDVRYQAARAGVLTIAVNCAVAGGTCFCVSMGTGPECRAGYDLVLTEILDNERHEFVVEAGSEIGEEIIAGLPGRPATDEDGSRVETLLARTSGAMGRSLEVEGLRELLQANAEHLRWAAVAERCLACANCTLVCPTCFCSTVEDGVGVDGSPATRVRRWDSCFDLDFSTLHQVPVRSSTKARYRQWMTHKLSTWYDQFGLSGCVGCGRCITWCPVGIDITREAAGFRKEAEVVV